MIGFIGLGIMGKPMVKNLLKAGAQVRVNDLVQSAVDEVAALGALPSTQAQIGADCDVVFTILPNGAIVQNVLFGENGVASTLRQGALVVDMSSVTPGESRACAERLAKQDVAFLDAPVSGGEPGAINGTLSFMVGGDEETFQRAQPYFDIMGSSAIRIGGVGSGSITKLANQIIVAANIQAVAEALTLAQKAGVDPDLVFQAIKGGLAGSTVLDAKGPMMLAGDDKPGFKIDLHIKDLNNALDTGHGLGTPMLLTAQVQEMLQWLHNNGDGQSDHSAILKYYERITGVEVRK